MRGMPMSPDRVRGCTPNWSSLPLRMRSMISIAQTTATAARSPRRLRGIQLIHLFFFSMEDLFLVRSSDISDIVVPD